MDKSKLNVNVDGSKISLLNKKRNIDEEDDSSNNISEKEIGIKKSKHSTKKSKDEEEEEEEDKKEDKEEDINKEEEEDLIFTTLKEVFDIIIKNKNLLDKNKEYKDKEIYKLIMKDDHDMAIICLRRLAIKIRKKLKDFCSENQKDYSLFLKQFTEPKEISIDLIIKIIITREIDPKQVLLNLKNNATNPNNS